MTDQPKSALIPAEHDPMTIGHFPAIQRSVSLAEISSPMTIVLADGDHRHNEEVAGQIASTFVGAPEEEAFYDKDLFTRADFPPKDHARFGGESE